MNIVYISTSTIPSRTANSIHVMKMCQAFAHNGHEVVLLAPDKKEDIEPGIDDVFDCYGVDPNFSLQKVTWYSLKGRGYIYGWLAARAAIRHKPDLVFCRNLIGCYFAALSGQKVIFESHSPIIDGGRLSEWFFKMLLKRKELYKLVVITHALKAYYEENYPELKGKIQVAPDGADPVPENVQLIDLPNKGNRLQLGYVGHLYEGKGMEVVVELAKHCCWADFHVVGGKERDISHWKDLVRGLSNITFYGFIPHSKTISYIKSFDILLLPNQPEVQANGKSDIGRWTSPLKMFEYMASGNPIIASDLAVLREVLENNKNALLCPPQEIKKWIEAISELNLNRKKMEKVGINALTCFSQKYSWLSRASTLVD